MRAILAVMFVIASVNVHAQDSVKTRGGDLKIEGSMYEPKLTLNGKVISTGESLAYGFPTQTKNKFVIKDTDVVLIGDTVSATCQMYFFVTIPAPPAVATKTDSFGTCDDSPKINQVGNTIVLRMNNSKGRTERFKYIDGKVGSII